jgi:YHS domain-containing protein
MIRLARVTSDRITRRIALFVACVAAAGFGPVAAADPEDVASSYLRLEYLVGSWKGQAAPKEPSAQRFRGWPETHAWAWVFQKGKLVGMKLTIEGGKTLASATLTYDPASKRFRLEGNAPPPSSGRLVFDGNLDASGKQLQLDQVGGAVAGGKGSVTRITIRPNSDFIRYTMAFDRKDAGDAQFTRKVEVGLTKEGETFAAGSNASERPKCIVTGGAAAMTLTYQGTSYPICCTGCRDEFNENPQKYLEKAKLIAASATSKPGSASAAPAGVSRFDDAFSRDVSSPAVADKKPAPMTDTGSSKIAQTTPQIVAAAAAKAKALSDKSSPPPASAVARAATLLKLGQNLEKNGNNSGALGYYRQIVKDFPTTPAAKTAAARIKAIGPR